LVVEGQNFELGAEGQWADVITSPIEEKPAIFQAKIGKLTAAIAKAENELKTAEDVMKEAHQNTLGMSRAGIAKVEEVDIPFLFFSPRETSSRGSRIRSRNSEEGEHA